MTLEWGLFGRKSDRWDYLEEADIEALPPQVKADLPDTPRPKGVIRLTNAGVRYTGAALDVGAPVPLWHQVEVAPKGVRLVMYLDGNDEPKPRTLARLAADLAKKRQESSRPNNALERETPELNELDWVALALLEATAWLHLENRSPGLLTPDNIIWVRSDGQRRLVLPDVGFQPPEGVGGELPPIVKAAAQPYAELWDDEPRVMTTRELDVVSDLKTVARLFDWVLSGEKRKTPRSEGGGMQQAYAVLEKVQRGEIQSPEEFKAQLLLKDSTKATCLSTFFTHGGGLRRDRKPTSWRKVAVAVVLGLVLVGAGVGGVYFAWQRVDRGHEHALLQGERLTARQYDWAKKLAQVRGEPLVIAALTPDATNDDKASLRDALRNLWDTLDPQLGVLKEMNDAMAAKPEATSALRDREEHIRQQLQDITRKDLDSIGSQMVFILLWEPNTEPCAEIAKFEAKYKRFREVTGFKEEAPWQFDLDQVKKKFDCP